MIDFLKNLFFEDNEILECMIIPISANKKAVPANYFTILIIFFISRRGVF